MRPVMTSKYASDLGRDALSACAKPRTAQHVVVHPRNAGCGGLKETRPASREGFRAARNSPISAVTIVCGFSPGRRLLPQGERGQGVRWPSRGLAGEPGPAPSAGLSAQGGPSGPAAVLTARQGSASSSSSRSGAGAGDKTVVASACGPVVATTAREGRYGVVRPGSAGCTPPRMTERG